MKMEEMTGGILAGGKSTRMGSNKARLHLPGDGKTFLQRIAGEMEDFARILISVDDKKRYRDLAWDLVEDKKKGFGPVEGLYQLLRAAKTQYTLIVATDMPFVRRELFADMAKCLGEGKEGPDCLILKKEGRPEPLCSIYSRRCLPVLKRMRAEEVHRIRMMYEEVNAQYISLEELGRSLDLVRNLNEKEQLRNLVSMQQTAETATEKGV